MHKLKEYLNLRELGEYLSGEYTESFYEIFGFISYFSIILYIIWSLKWIPPIKGVITELKKSIESPFTESFLIKELIPNNRVRLHAYKVLMLLAVFCSMFSYFSSFYYGSASLAAILANNIAMNRFTAFIILALLSVFMLTIATYYIKEANKIAKFLHEQKAL